MKIENAVRMVAGLVILVSISLGHWVSEWWLLLGAFVSLSLIQSAFTGICPAGIVLTKLGVGKDGGSCCR
jgi:hypothetical protein